MVEFIIVPAETIVACNYILCETDLAIPTDRSRNNSSSKEFGKLLSKGKALIQSIAWWPAILQAHSSYHTAVNELHEVASMWLERSPLFEEHRNERQWYLKRLPGFSTNGLITDGESVMKNRRVILLEQNVVAKFLKNSDEQRAFFMNAVANKRSYQQFLTQFIWMRDDPLLSMFAHELQGVFRAHASDTGSGEASRQFGVSVADDAFTVTIHTPSTIRATSPTLAQPLNNSVKDDDRDKQPIKLPTLKYIAIVETDTDKAIFDLNISDVSEKKRRIMNSAKEMCTEMVSKGYGGKVKLQDIMDMAVKMEDKTVPIPISSGFGNSPMSLLH